MNIDVLNMQVEISRLSQHKVLSRREVTVLQYVLAGYSIQKIADISGLSKKTISAQKCAAYRKLGIRDDGHLIASLYEHLGKPSV